MDLSVILLLSDICT